MPVPMSTFPKSPVIPLLVTVNPEQRGRKVWLLLKTANGTLLGWYPLEWISHATQSHSFCSTRLHPNGLPLVIITESALHFSFTHSIYSPPTNKCPQLTLTCSSTYTFMCGASNNLSRNTPTWNICALKGLGCCRQTKERNCWDGGVG